MLYMWKQKMDRQGHPNEISKQTFIILREVRKAVFVDLFRQMLNNRLCDIPPSLYSITPKLEEHR